MDGDVTEIDRGGRRAAAAAATGLRAIARRYTPAAATGGDRRAAVPAATTRHASPCRSRYVRLTQPLVRDTKGGELRPATWG